MVINRSLFLFQCFKELQRGLQKSSWQGGLGCWLLYSYGCRLWGASELDLGWGTNGWAPHLVVDIVAWGWSWKAQRKVEGNCPDIAKKLADGRARGGEGWGKSTGNMRAYQKEAINLSGVKNQEQKLTTLFISVTPSWSFNSNFYRKKYSLANL